MPIFIILVATLMILGIAYFQVSQGLFNSLIMAVLTILSAALAFSLYEPIAAGMDLYKYMPTLAEPIVLILTFCGLVYGLRALFDWAIKGNVVFGQWPDRIGGGLFGLITGIVMVGMWLVTLQLMPFDPSLWTYRPFDKTLQRAEYVPPFYPDDFVLGMTNMLSEGSLKTGDDRFFSKTHENLLLDTYCWRNGKVDKNGTYVGRKDAKPGSMIIMPFKAESSQTQSAEDATVQSAQAPIYVPPNQETFTAEWFRQQNMPRYPLFSDTETKKTKFVIVRVAVRDDLTEESTQNNPAAGWYFLPASHFRLVGRSRDKEGKPLLDKDGKPKPPQSYYPVAYLTYQPQGSGPLPGKTATETDTGPLCICAPDSGGKSEVASLVAQRPGSCTIQATPNFKGLVVDWVFQVPADETFCPTEKQMKEGDTDCGFIVFRRIIRQDFDAELPQMPSLKNMLLRAPPKK